MTIEEKLKERAELVKNALSDKYKVDCVNDRWVVIFEFGDADHGVLLKNAIMDGTTPMAIDINVFRNDDPTDIILTEEAVNFGEVSSKVNSFYNKYSNPNTSPKYDTIQDIEDLRKELQDKTGFKFMVRKKDGKLVIDRLYQECCYFAVEDIKLTEDSKVESATVTLKYDDMPRQKAHLSFGNIPREEIAQSMDKLYWVISCSMDTPYMGILEALNLCCV